MSGVQEKQHAVSAAASRARHLCKRRGGNQVTESCGRRCLGAKKGSGMAPRQAGERTGQRGSNLASKRAFNKPGGEEPASNRGIHHANVLRKTIRRCHGVQTSKTHATFEPMPRLCQLLLLYAPPRPGDPQESSRDCTYPRGPRFRPQALNSRRPFLCILSLGCCPEEARGRRHYGKRHSGHVMAARATSGRAASARCVRNHHRYWRRPMESPNNVARAATGQHVAICRHLCPAIKPWTKRHLVQWICFPLSRRVLAPARPCRCPRLPTLRQAS